MSQESRRKHHSSTSSSLELSANITTKTSSPNRGGRGGHFLGKGGRYFHNRDGGGTRGHGSCRGYSPSFPSTADNRPTYQVCFKFGHSALTCNNRFNQAYEQDPPAHMAYCSSSRSLSDTAWSLTLPPLIILPPSCLTSIFSPMNIQVMSNFAWVMVRPFPFITLVPLCLLLLTLISSYIVCYMCLLSPKISSSCVSSVRTIVFCFSFTHTRFFLRMSKRRPPFSKAAPVMGCMSFPFSSSTSSSHLSHGLAHPPWTSSFSGCSSGSLFSASIFFSCYSPCYVLCLCSSQTTLTSILSYCLSIHYPFGFNFW